MAPRIFTFMPMFSTRQVDYTWLSHQISSNPAYKIKACSLRFLFYFILFIYLFIYFLSLIWQIRSIMFFGQVSRSDISKIYWLTASEALFYSNIYHFTSVCSAFDCESIWSLSPNLTLALLCSVSQVMIWLDQSKPALYCPDEITKRF